MTMTLEQVRDELARIGWYGKLVAAIDDHLTTPPEIPVSAGKAVAYRYRSPGIEDGWVVFQSHARAKALEGDNFILQPLYATPPPPAGFRVVPEERKSPPIYPDESREDQAMAEAYNSGWNACRKAMLAAHDAGGV